jgi:hypothetical protein
MHRALVQPLDDPGVGKRFAALKLLPLCFRGRDPARFPEEPIEFDQPDSERLLKLAREPRLACSARSDDGNPVQRRFDI